MKSIYLKDSWPYLQEIKEDGEAIIFETEIEDSKIIYPFVKRKAGEFKEKKYYDIVTPRGQGGPRIINNNLNNGNLLKKFNEEFSKYCAKENIIAEYIRFDPWTNNEKDFGFIYEVNYHGTMFCNDLTIDFFNDEYKSSKRNDIRKALKNNVEIFFDNSKRSLNEFLKLYSFTSEKYNIDNFYSLNKDFLSRYFNLLPNDVYLAKAIYKGKNVSTALILFGDDIAHYHFSASDPEYINTQANSLLIYESEKFASAHGKKLFDLGRAKEGSHLENFKKSFIYKSEKTYPYSIGTKIRNEYIYDKLVDKVGGPNIGYFPEYRK